MRDPSTRFILTITGLLEMGSVLHMQMPEAVSSRCFAKQALHGFFISNSIFGVNVGVAQQVYVFKAKSCLGFAQKFPTFLTIFTNFSTVTSVCPKYYSTQQSCIENSYRKILLQLIKIQPKFFRSSVFNVGGCLTSCLIFRAFLTLDPWQLRCL